ncbi:MAG: leucine-rich repeat protein [Lachnospiraceae bacterium]|nr:leucine-rich repeat protein [Lachnospiraceae bacterium]
MSNKLKKIIALIAVFSLVFTSVPMDSGTVKAQAADEKILETDWMDSWHAAQYYLLKDKLGGLDKDKDDWKDIIDAIEDYRNLTTTDVDALDEEIRQFEFDTVEIPDGTVYNDFGAVATKKVSVATSGAISVETRYNDINDEYYAQSIRIYGKNSALDGLVTVYDSGNVPDYSRNSLELFDGAEVTVGKSYGILEIYGDDSIDKCAMVDINDGAVMTIEGTLRLLDKGYIWVDRGGTLNLNGTVICKNGGYIWANEGSIINKNGKALVAKGSIYGIEIKFDGKQEGYYNIYLNGKGEWKYQEVEMKKEIVLPAEIDDFYYADNLNRTINGEDVPYVFDKVTFTEDTKWNNYIRTKELVVKDGVTVTVVTGQDDNDPDNKWSCDIEAYSATIEGTVILENSDVEDEFYDPEDPWGNPYCINRITTNKLTVADKGKIIAKGNAEINFTTVFEIIFGKKDIELGDVTINIPNVNALSSETLTTFPPNTVVNVGGKPYAIKAWSGNEGDEAVHDYYFDGTNDSWTFISFNKDGNWKLEEAVWWGGPFDNELRVFFDEGEVKVNGTAITTNDFVSFTKGKAIEFELIPPANYTGTPIVFINGGWYGADEDGINTIYRSDDFVASDLWYSNVKKIEVKDNKFSFTPASTEGVSISVIWDPEEVMTNALGDLEGQYRWAASKDKNGNWKWADDSYDAKDNGGYGPLKGWDVPGNEFMVEVSGNSYGTITLTPGFDFYRLGNKVKAFYQGYELLTGTKSVDVVFTPENGFELSELIIDGTSYVPSSVNGLTSSNGVYTYKITKTPEKKSSLIESGIGTTDIYRDAVKITTIQAVFSAIYIPGGDSTTETTPTPEPTQAPATPTPTPEVTVEKEDDGSTTTTTVTENADGSKTIETETKDADGTVTISTTTENKDGSSVTETEIKNTDGSKTTETVVENADGSSTKVSETVDKDGNVLSTTEEEVSTNSKGTEIVETRTENADGSSVESVVKTTTDGKVVAEVVEIDSKGKLAITLETDKPDGSEVTKTFEAAKDDGIKLTEYETKGNTAIVPGEIKVGDTTYVVTTIGKGAMAGNKDIKKIKLPESITTIGKGAFENAKNLKKIELGSEITKVSKNAFAGIAKNAQIRITATKEEFDRIVALIKASGVDSSIQFKRVKPE